MVNLLGIKKRGGEETDNSSGNKASQKKENEYPEEMNVAETIGQQDKGVNIKHYKDPEGLSLFNLEIGLWIIRHRQKFYKAALLILICTSVVTWSIFLYNYGYYYIFGIRADKNLLARIAQNDNNIHELVLAQAPLELLPHSLGFIEGGENKYDIYLKIDNPNEKQWAEFSYYFNSGEVIFGRAEGFILPGESKFILSLANDAGPRFTKVEFHLDNIKWGRISNKNFKDWETFKSDRLDFTINETKFTPANSSNLTERVNLSTLDFKISNNTTYNYWGVDLNILLYSRDNIIGVNTFRVDQLMSEETRELNVTWPGRMGRVTEIKVEPGLNITKNDIYIAHDTGPGEMK